MSSAKRTHPIAKRAPAGTAPGLPVGYPEFLEDIKSRIRSAQIKASLSASRELILLYWDLGRSIVDRQQRDGWGKSVVDKLAEDLQRAFPGMEGFSPRNVWRMRAFYLAWTEAVLAQPARESGSAILTRPVSELDGLNLPRPVSEIPWGHNIALFQKLKDPVQRLWYAKMTTEHGWSLPVLVLQIESGLFKRQGKAVTNFKRTLPPPQSDLAQQALKDTNGNGTPSAVLLLP
jgi:predicted nuclease of restriction endonuclease-like (RecB) superfamily